MIIIRNKHSIFIIYLGYKYFRIRHIEEENFLVCQNVNEAFQNNRFMFIENQ